MIKVPGQPQTRGLLTHCIKSIRRQFQFSQPLPSAINSAAELSTTMTLSSTPVPVASRVTEIMPHHHLPRSHGPRIMKPSLTLTSHVNLHCPSRNYGRYEPDYLDPKGPQIAKYELINFQITGYDYTILEEFGKFVHNSAERFGYEVEDAWGSPCKHLKITRLKPESTVVEAEYKLQLYERNIQLAYPDSPTLSLFVDIMHSSLPAGVKLRVQPHFKEYTEVRLIPDLSLKEVRNQLDELISGRAKKKK